MTSKRERMLLEFAQRLYGEDNVVRAVLDLARLGNVAIAYLTRVEFAHHMNDKRGTPLTEEEWTKIRNFDQDYDDFVDSTNGPTGDYVSDEFMDYWLDKYDIPGPDGQKWSE